VTGGPPPTALGEAIPGAAPFDAQLTLDPQWGGKSPGQLALADRLAAGDAASALNAFVHGTTHSDLRRPFQIEAWLGAGARLVMHLNSVSSGAIVTVRVDGREIHREALPNTDGGFQVNNEYNRDIPLALPAGRHRVEIRNAGADWFYLDWIRLEAVLPARYAPDWHRSPAAVGLAGQGETLIYVVNPAINFPAGATLAQVDPMPGAQVVLSNWPAGNYRAQWFDPATARPLGETRAAANAGVLALPLPDLAEDLAGRLLRAPTLRAAPDPDASLTRLAFEAEPGAICSLEQSHDLLLWRPWTNWVPSGPVSEFVSTSPAQGSAAIFFRGALR
jgi:hypothetical protein